MGRMAKCFVTDGKTESRLSDTKQRRSKDWSRYAAFYFRISLVTLSYSHAINAWELAP
jgi:hypothetical protein